MIIGVPREIKSDEYRVAMLPSGVEELVNVKLLQRNNELSASQGQSIEVTALFVIR